MHIPPCPQVFKTTFGGFEEQMKHSRLDFTSWDMDSSGLASINLKYDGFISVFD